MTPAGNESMATCSGRVPTGPSLRSLWAPGPTLWPPWSSPSFSFSSSRATSDVPPRGNSHLDDSVILLVVIVYFATFFVNGFVSGAVFRQGFFPRVSPGWQRVAFISAGLGPCFLRFHDSWIVIVLVVYCALCAIAVVHRNIPSFPRKTLALLLALFLFVALPLQLAGTVLGRNLRGNPHNPCRITAVPSPVPRAAFYATPRFIALVSGLIPFGSIFIEIFFLFASLWSYKYYYVYGFLAAMTAILVIIESCVSIVGTYILLNAENHHWRWTSFLSGASIGVYLFLYCVYFYCCKTQMNGFVQAAYFFGESVRMDRQSQL